MIDNTDGLTTDPNDPELTHYRGPEKAAPQAKKYLVLAEKERAKGFIRPVRTAYVHTKCGKETKMNIVLAETYARDPGFYGATFCIHCSAHFPVREFKWSGTDENVGS